MTVNYKHRFDFEIGYLIKSPCRECMERYRFPLCSDNCDILDEIHSVMASSVSCSRSYLSMDSGSAAGRGSKGK